MPESPDIATITIPEPKGHRCCVVVFKNGQSLAMQETQERFVERYKAFQADESQQLLEIIDVQYGMPVYLTRGGVAGITQIAVAWVDSVAPTSRQIAVVKDLPPSPNGIG